MEKNIEELNKDIEQLQMKYEQLLSRTGHQSKLIEMLEDKMNAIESKTNYLDMQFERMIQGRNSLGI